LPKEKWPHLKGKSQGRGFQGCGAPGERGGISSKEKKYDAEEDRRGERRAFGSGSYAWGQAMEIKRGPGRGAINS